MDENIREQDLPEEEIATTAPEEAEIPDEQNMEETEQPEEEQLEKQEEEPPEEEQEEQEEQPEEQKPVKGPGAWAWTVAVAMMLFGLVMVIPAGVNTMLALPAAWGLACELNNDYQNAMSTYNLMQEMEDGLTEWAFENFSFGGGEAPGFTSNHFWYERSIAMTHRMYGPYFLYLRNVMGLYEEEGMRLPRSLRETDRQIKIISEIMELYEQQAAGGVQNAQEAGERLEAARASDKKAGERKLYYDTFALMILSADIASDEVGERVAALKNDPAGEPWMFAAIEMERARVLEDYNLLIKLCDEQLARDKKDYTAMADQVRATYLLGKTEQAYALADAYTKKAPGVRGFMQLAKAELDYREGDYKQAVKRCDELIAAEENSLTSNGASLAADAQGVKAIVLLLQGKADKALEELRPLAEAPSIQLSQSFCYTTLVAASLAGDSDFFAYFIQLMMYSFGYNDIPQEIMDLQAGELTVEEIYTEGWGGFSA